MYLSCTSEHEYPQQYKTPVGNGLHTGCCSKENTYLFCCFNVLITDLGLGTWHSCGPVYLVDAPKRRVLRLSMGWPWPYRCFNIDCGLLLCFLLLLSVLCVDTVDCCHLSQRWTSAPHLTPWTPTPRSVALEPVRPRPRPQPPPRPRPQPWPQPQPRPQPRGCPLSSCWVPRRRPRPPAKSLPRSPPLPSLWPSRGHTEEVLPAWGWALALCRPVPWVPGASPPAPWGGSCRPAPWPPSPPVPWGQGFAPSLWGWGWARPSRR